ncbi:MAG: 3-isopropylmalate dehydrogenase [Sphingomonadaceae bacterium]
MGSTLLLLPGDGIGPEVTAVSRRVAEYLAGNGGVDLTIIEAEFGGAAIDAVGTALPDETLEIALAADAVLMGAIGGLKWARESLDKRPEAGLLRLRKAMGVYANLRPAYCFPVLANSSSLKIEYVSGLDILFVRELIGGIYFGRPRGIEDIGGGERRGVNTQVYTSSEIRRVARMAFTLAAQRSGKVCSVDKSNVMESGLLWRQEVTAIQQAEFRDVELIHMLADNCAMQLVKEPKQFDVILTDNLFGDILSDEAAMLTGSIGMLPSAALGEPGTPGLYEPIHGAAPEIAGQCVANPCASVLSLAMALRYSLNRPDLAYRIENAIAVILESGVRTRDLGGRASTQAVGDALLQALDR